MQLPLEDLEYQRRAIAAVVGMLEGQVRNSFDNSNLFGIQANITDLTPAQIEENKKRIITQNGIAEADAKLSPDPDICIEMETGTGKTLVYLRTIYELYQRYRLTKFIILVPSIAIKEGVLSTIDTFKKPLADRYDFTPACFEYDSGKLSRLRHFIEDTQPQIMVKKIEVLSVAEKNDEATLKIELAGVQTNGGANPKATLNQSYSDTKKRQELGRGLRICRNQSGQRIYDAEGTKEGEEINLLTIVPNETYETFAAQYQEQIKEVYGTADAGGVLRKKHKGKSSTKRIKRRDNLFEGKAFRAFWKNLARRTDYVVDFREDEIVRRATEEINRVTVPAYEAQIALNRITGITREAGLNPDYQGGDTVALRGVFSPLDLIEEWSEGTGLSYEVVFRILRGVTNWGQMTRNPYAYTQTAVGILCRVELEEKLRGLRYSPTGEVYPLAQFEALVERHIAVQPTPQHGVYDGVFCDSGSTFEHEFAAKADADPQVLCFIKLPDFYKIPTPFGDYTPDFGLVLRDPSLKGGERDELYFVIETKGTNDLDHPRALTEDERRRIRCAMKHFEAIGIRTITPLPHQAPAQPELTGRDAYVAPVKDYQPDFKDKVTL